MLMIRRAKFVFLALVAVVIFLVLFGKVEVDSHRMVWTKTSPSVAVLQGRSLLDRVDSFNLALERVRTYELPRSTFERTPPFVQEDFVEQVSLEFPQVKTLTMPWRQKNHDEVQQSSRRREWSSLTDIFNLLVQRVYPWSASSTICDELANNEEEKTAAQKNETSRLCQVINKTMYARSLEPGYLSELPLESDRYWPIHPRFYFPLNESIRDPPASVFRIHIIRDVGITDLGDIVSGNLTVVYGCRWKYTVNGSAVNMTSRLAAHLEVTVKNFHVQNYAIPGKPSWPRNISQIPLFEEVYVITQLFGRNYYHYMVDGLPRLAVHLEFLRRNSAVKIHIPEDCPTRLKELLNLLGLNQSRFVSGTIRARISYLPRCRWCVNALVPEIQILADEYRKLIGIRFPEPEKRDRLILIHRTEVRKWPNLSDNVTEVLEEVAKKHGLRFAVFSDATETSLDDTMRLFHSAVIVVGPHGAGFANIIFSQPSTFVVEGLFWNIFCFRLLALELGHHLHGARPFGVNHIKSIVEELLRLDKSSTNHLLRT